MTIQNVQVGFGMQMQMQQPCPKCEGKGRTHAHKCDKCHGHRVYQEEQILEYTIEKGMVHGETIVFEREGPQQPDFMPGDVILSLNLKKHKRFKRVDDDLYTEMKLTLEEALLGFSKPMTMLDGRKIEVRSEPGEIIQPFSWKVIENEGMPLKDDPTDQGKLHIKFKVSVPKELSDEQKRIVEEIFKEDEE